jgi:hypothetical protein
MTQIENLVSPEEITATFILDSKSYLKFIWSEIRLANVGITSDKDCIFILSLKVHLSSKTLNFWSSGGAF